MELLKGFFRKRKTIIFTAIFSVVFLGILFLFSFSKYYDDLLDNYIQTNSYISFVSQKDYSSDILKMKSVRSVKKGILLLPDYSYNTLSKNMNIDEKDMNNNNQDDYFEDSNIYWDLFLLNDEYTDVYLDSDFNYKLSKGETIILFPFEILNNSQQDTINKMKNKKIGFNTINGDKVELKIINTYDFPNATILVSKEDYDILKSKMAIYSYRINTTNYKFLDQTRKELLDLEHEDNFGVLERSYASDESYRQQLVSLILFLKIGNYVAISLMFITFVVICNDIIKEERKNIYIERMAGYNKLQVCKQLLLNILLLLSLSIFIAVLLSIFGFTLVNLIFDLKISVFDISIILQVIKIIFVIFIFELFIFFFQINKCLKKDYMKILK